MVRYLTLLLVFSLFILSCDKTNLKKMEDDISYKKYSPYLALNPVDSVGQISNSKCIRSFPFPSDSTTFVEIDIDKDGQNDFRFTYTTNYDLISATDSCENYSSIIEAKGIGVGNNVLIENDITERLQIFEEDDKIPNTSKLANEAIVFLEDFTESENVEFGKGNKYIGLKLDLGGFAWIKCFHTKDSIRFSIMEYGYNNNIHMDIKAGQKD